MAKQQFDMRGLKMFGGNNVEQRSLPTTVTHNFYVYGVIEDDITSYVDMITTLDYASEYDIINIYLNTPGGSLNTAISIIHAMMRSQARVITHADGEVASAGTLIFFAGQMYIVYPYSHFMLHDATEGGVSKVNETMKRIHATSDLVEKIAMDLYCPVFSEEEVIDILEGRDYYCSAEEMYDRIHKVNEEEQEKQETDEIEEEPKTFKVTNPDLKSYGEVGTVKAGSATSVVLELSNGQTIKVNRSNVEPV